MRVGDAGCAELPVGHARGAAALEQERVGAGGRGEGELVEGQDLAAVLEDALASLLGEAEGADLK